MIDLVKMIEIQESYDCASLRENGGSYHKIIQANGYFYAILDEVGEWNHECKAQWCWFRKVDYVPEKVLEEFSDVLHMTLSFVLAMVGKKKAIEYFLLLDPFLECPESEAILSLLDAVNIPKNLYETDRNKKAFQALGAILQLSGRYDEQELLRVFELKNELNLKRIKKG